MSLNFLLSKSCYLLLFLLPLLSFGQEQISGKVYDAQDSTAMEGVFVYFDGTSLGTYTDKQGIFSLKNYSGSVSIIMSFLGYETAVVDISSYSKEVPTIYLKEKQEVLPYVTVEADPWSREKKLGIFRREFLGRTREAGKSRIQNEDVLQLFYSPSSETLTGEATEPLIIVNEYLGYEVEYDLESFKVDFSTGSSGLRLTQMVTYEGFSYFRELKNKPSKKILRNREKTYLGSSLHFMRALSNKDLSGNNFRIFYDKLEVPPLKYFEIGKEGEWVKVNLLVDGVNIVYGNLDQSGLQTRSTFYIDKFGNHFPPTNVIFWGKMSRSRVGHLLPLNYSSEE